MADIFGSSKQPSLFPMLVSSPSISKEDYILFYKNERSLFTILLVILHREVVQSIFIMGFLLWLEKEGYTSLNLVETFINSLTPDVIDRVADEVVICLKFLEKKSNNLIFEATSTSRSHEISLLQCYLDRKRIHLDELHQNRDLIFDEVAHMANHVSNKGFDDILEQFIRCGEPLVLHSPREVNVGCGVGGFRYIGPVVPFHSYDITKYAAYHQKSIVGEDANHHALLTLGICLRQQRNSGVSHLLAEALSPSVLRDPQEELHTPPENRTIFLTFSKGYPISESEVRNYFTRMFGDFIESIHMQPVDPENQPLFARIVARSPSMVRAVVDRDGVDGKSKYYINGKHVWARKYVKRSPTS